MNPTARWTAGLAAAAVLATVGAAAGYASLLLAAVVPLLYLAYGVLSTADADVTLRANRVVEPATVPPGQTVSVTLTVENVGANPLPDVRVVDTVPEALGVIDDSPRAGTALEPGDTLQVEYGVVAKRGDHRFGRPHARVRSFGAGAAADRTVAAAGDDRLRCRLDASAPPIEQEGDRFAGGMPTDSPGQGLEFHSTRPYQRDDPASRIDWRHYAKRDELTTVNYRERHASSVVLVVDARPASRVVAGPARPTAVELAAYAATHALEDLLGTGHEVGVAVVGADGPDAAGLHWLAPGPGHDRRARARDLLAAATETTADEPEVDPETQASRVATLAPPRAQLVLFSPLLDGWPVETVEAWGVRDYSRVVLSPDVLTHNTATGQFETVRRHTRLVNCQAAGARAVDWSRATPLYVVLEAAFAADARGALTGGSS
ncbi:DUF58 domain-containing protein [Halorientalis sp.]|uniref:DUF58 domain-containing protein n=1 Tax=Halorientalis sp. TaxID=1931229 RepID=UPI0026275ABB|nr:DUF58 domain-containing protein [Halorientalis sp.]